MFTILRITFATLTVAVGLALGADRDPERHALPPPGPPAPRDTVAVLFADDFSDSTLAGWEADRDGVWSVRHGMLRADLPDEKQQHSLLYAGSPDWQDIAVDVDVCAMRGVDKGVVVRVDDNTGIGVDLRGPGYQDVLLHRRQWPLGKARVLNGNAIWHHIRVEALGSRYRVFVNRRLVIEHVDRRSTEQAGRIALAAYTGGVGKCTVWYDNVVVTALTAPAADSSR